MIAAVLVLTAVLSDSPGTPTETLWELRAGVTHSLQVSAPGAEYYIQALNADNNPGGTPVSDLVSRGMIRTAEQVISSQGESPVTRNELLGVLAWSARFLLYDLMAYHNQPPPDMEGKLLSDQCAAVCALGWMTVRQDGLFHGEEPVSRGDLALLQQFFPGTDASVDYLSSSGLLTIEDEVTRFANEN